MLEPFGQQWQFLLRALRKRNGMSQSELSQQLGVSAQTVSRWETGQNKPAKKYQALILKIWEATMKHPKGEIGDCEYKSYVITHELTADGRKANVENKKNIVANVTMKEFLWGTITEGRIGEVSVSPGHITRTFRQTGRAYRIQDLETELRPGESMEICFKYELLDAFLAKQEYVGADVIAPTRYLRLVVRFPKQRVPTGFWAFGILEGQQIEVQEPVVPSKSKNYFTLTWQTDKPELNAIYSIGWEW